MTTLSAAGQPAEADDVATRLVELGAPRPLLLRPPYGSYNADTTQLGYCVVLWNVDSEDWKNRNAATTTVNTMAQVRPGSIVLMHDIHPSTVEAMPGIIEKLQAQGYVLVTVPELMGQTRSGQVIFGRP